MMRMGAALREPPAPKPTGKRLVQEDELDAGGDERPFTLWRRVKPRSDEPLLKAVVEVPEAAAAVSSPAPLPPSPQPASAPLARRVFDRSLLDAKFVGREDDRAMIVSSIASHLTAQRSGSIYIAGLPGTGKTAMLDVVRTDLSKLAAHRFVHVNCMQLASGRQIFGRIFDDGRDDDDASLLSRLTRTSVVLVLDEMDSLVSRDNEVIYRLFELTRLPSSRLVLVGVANTLDLIERRLPRLAQHACRPMQVSIRSYTQEQLLAILEARQAHLPHPLADRSALELCARKVAAKHGDARKALDIVFQALTAWEARHASSVQVPPLPITALHAALMASYATERARQLATLPLLSKRVLCAMFALAHRKKPPTLDELKRAYHDQWTSDVPGAPPAPRCSRDEFKTMCEPLVGMGVLATAGPRGDPWRNVSIELRDEDVEDALADDPVLTTMLKRALDLRAI